MDSGNEEKEPTNSGISTESITDELVNPGYKKLYYNGGSEGGDIEEAGEILAEAYDKVAIPTFKLMLVLIICLLIIDAIFGIPLRIYSSSIAFVGSVLLVYPRLAGKYKVAISATENKRIQMMKEAELAAFSNAGFLLLLIGFGLEIVYFLIL